MYVIQVLTNRLSQHEGFALRAASSTALVSRYGIDSNESPRIPTAINPLIFPTYLRVNEREGVIFLCGIRSGTRVVR